MKRILTVLGVFALCLPALAQQKSIEGDWLGQLSFNGTTLRVVFHINKTPNGYTATAESPDQGRSIPASSVTLQGDDVTLDIAALGANFKGKLSADAGSIEGTFSQGMGQLPLLVKRTSEPQVVPRSLEGNWLGKLTFNGMTLRVVFHINKSANGYTATAESPDQGARNIPVSSVTQKGDDVFFGVDALGAEFQGKLTADAASMDGTFFQGGNRIPLVLKRVSEAELVERRPQDPVKPYPYRDEDVSFENKTAGIKLAGTVTTPSDTSRHTAVVLISGSGRQNRDCEVFGHRPFLVLADYLTRKGITVLRVDDRGVGKSEGNFGAATTADFATDVESAVAYLKTRSDVDPKRIGLIGLSEGGIIGPMVASRNPDVAFVVMMAGTGVPGSILIPEQVKLLATAAGMPADKVEEQAQEIREAISLVQTEKDQAELQKKLRATLGKSTPEAQVGAAVASLSSPWFKYFVAYDPAAALRKLKCPVLALNGSLDKQVPAAQNLPVIRKALEQAGNKHFEALELPGLNHLFQTAKTGGEGEYSQIAETMSTVALDKVAEWVSKQGAR